MHPSSHSGSRVDFSCRKGRLASSLISRPPASWYGWRRLQPRRLCSLSWQLARVLGFAGQQRRHRLLCAPRILPLALRGAPGWSLRWRPRSGSVCIFAVKLSRRPIPRHVAALALVRFSTGRRRVRRARLREWRRGSKSVFARRSGGLLGRPPSRLSLLLTLPCYSAAQAPKLAHTESRFLLDFDEPDGVPGRFELLPLCVAGGCQW